MLSSLTDQQFAETLRQQTIVPIQGTVEKWLCLKHSTRCGGVQSLHPKPRADESVAHSVVVVVEETLQVPLDST